MGTSPRGVLREQPGGQGSRGELELGAVIVFPSLFLEGKVLQQCAAGMSSASLTLAPMKRSN